MNLVQEDDYSDYRIPISKILDSGKQFGNLFVGNYESGELERIRAHKIGAVVTAAKDCDIVSYKPEDKVVHIRLDDAEDTDDFPINKYFESTFQFIDKHLKTTNVLVHCFAGVQRSVTIVAAYIIRREKKNAQDTLVFIKSKRKIAEPNEGFVKQLEDYHTKLFKQQKTANLTQKPILQQQKMVQQQTKPKSHPVQTQQQPKQQLKPVIQSSQPLVRKPQIQQQQQSKPLGKQTKK